MCDSVSIKVKWPKIMDYKDIDAPPLMTWINLCNGTMFRLIAFFCHGGFKYPRSGLFIGIERIGCFHFDLKNRKSAEYVSEKLGIALSDAAILADWINAQLNFEYKQEGEYYITHYLDNEPYGLSGENKVLPLVPILLEEGAAT